MMSLEQFRQILMIIAVYLFVPLANSCLPTGEFSKDLHLVILQTDSYLETFEEQLRCVFPLDLPKLLISGINFCFKVHLTFIKTKQLFNILKPYICYKHFADKLKIGKQIYIYRKISIYIFHHYKWCARWQQRF